MSLSSISLPLCPFSHLSVILISPFISPAYQSSIYSSSIYLLSLFPSVSSSIHSPILPFHSSIHLGILCHPYLSIYLPPLSMSLIYFSASLSIDPPFHPSYLSIYLSYPSYPSIICLSTYAPIYPSICLSRLSFYLVSHPFFHYTYVSYLCIICIYLSLSHLCICMFSPLFQVSTQT